MDLSSLKDQVSNLTVYDLKAGIRKVQNGRRTTEPYTHWSTLTLGASGHELYRDGSKGAGSDKQ
jgi:hypothetical protein